MSNSFNKITIVGVGLIGGSLGLAIKQCYPRVRVVGVDIAESIVTRARERGAVDEGSTDLALGVGNADLVFLAPPVQVIAELLPLLGTLLSPDALVTDVGSTKARICQIAQKFLPSRFIGGHPMTGSERQGIEAADPLLFENALYVLTPVAVPDEPRERLREFLEGLGAALADLIAQQNQQDALYAELAAGGFRDMTRIAASPYDIWHGILHENASEIERALEAFLEELHTIKEQVRGDLRARFQDAATFRNAILSSSKGFLTPLHRVAVCVADRLPRLKGVIQGGASSFDRK